MLTKLKTLHLGKKSMLSIVLVVALLISYFAFFKKEVQAEMEIKEITPKIGTIIKSLDGSGTIQPLEQYDIISLVGGDILADYVEVGTTVNAGDLLYHINSSEIERNIEKAENALQKQQNSYNNALNSIDDLNVKSDISGIVSEIFVTDGQQISNGAKILDVIDTSSLIISLPFHKESTKNISVNDSAVVVIETTGETLDGVVTNIASGEYISANGTLVCDVEISVKNPGVITEDYTGSATINGISPASISNFEYETKSSIISNTSGKVENISVLKGDKVSNGSLVVTLSNDSLKTNIANDALSLDDSILSYEQSLEQLEDYKLTSPINGTIIQKDYKTGDTIENGKTSLGIVADMSKVKFTMQIDELNIKEISEGLEVFITADAMPSQSFVGKITNIGIIGTENSGVTTYPVEVVIENYEGLLPGMNVNATIVTEKAENIITIPSGFVARGNMVLVSEEYAKNLEISEQPVAGKLSPMKSNVDGYVYMYVETGIADGTNIEITNGLTEDISIYLQIVIATPNNNGEDMPIGGMPSGERPTSVTMVPSGGGGARGGK